jgi:DNA-binding MarR family transcriptional regulator
MSYRGGATVTVLKLKPRRAAPDDAARASPRLPLSISRAELLIDGSDREFRRLIHRMLISAGRLDAIREAIARRIGVTGTQYTMLMSVLHLQGATGISIGGLAEYLQVTGPHVTGVIGKLAALGLVRKTVNPRDRRGVLVRLTPVGRKRLIATFDFICGVNDRLFDGVNRDEYRVLANFNAKFIGTTQATLDWIDRQSPARERVKLVEF